MLHAKRLSRITLHGLLGLAVVTPGIAMAGEPISAFAAQWLKQQYTRPGSRVETSATPVSERLRLAPCPGAMRASLPQNLRPMPRMSVMVKCTAGAQQWSVRVPVLLRLYRPVLVTTHPLLRGDGISAGDVRREERDITRLGYGYVENLQQADGRTLAHALPANAVLTPAALGGRQMVSAGDRVQVLAQLGGIEVRAAGIALGSGDNGARLRVRNDASGRIVDAMVSAPGVVTALP